MLQYQAVVHGLVTRNRLVVGSFSGLITRTPPVLRSQFTLSVLGLAACLLLSSCDAVPGVRDLGDTPPAISDLSFSPTVIDISQIDPSDIVDGEFDVSLQISATVEAGDLDSVYFVVRPPLRSGTPVAVGTLGAASASRYSVSETLRLPVGQPGNYTVVVYAADAAGQLSNQVQGNLLLDATNAPGSPPEITLVEAFPEVLTPPATLFIVATVTDPDGAVNVLRVQIKTPSGESFNMFDDGDTAGDAEAGDGKWTAAFNVPVGSPAGPAVFELQAFDRNGNESAVVQKTVTIN